MSNSTRIDLWLCRISIACSWLLVSQVVFIELSGTESVRLAAATASSILSLNSSTMLKTVDWPMPYSSPKLQIVL